MRLRRAKALGRTRAAIVPLKQRRVVACGAFVWLLHGRTSNGLSRTIPKLDHYYQRRKP
jgi:hypothetical protein